jgi:hypothetical protein
MLSGVTNLLKSCEWYNVYEMRMAINLLEPWEKCLANTVVISVLFLTFYGLMWIVQAIVY